MKKVTLTEYETLFPINGKYNKWLEDKITAYRVYEPFHHLFEKIYYHLYKRDGFWHIISKNFEESKEGVFNLIKEKDVTLTSNTSTKRNEICFSRHSFKINDINADILDVDNLVFDENLENNNDRTDVNILLEKTNSTLDKTQVVKLYILNETGSNPKISSMYLVNFQDGNQWVELNPDTDLFIFPDVEKAMKEICIYTPQLELFSVDILPTKEGFKIINFYGNPQYPISLNGFGEEINRYLTKALENEQANPCRKELKLESDRLMKRREFVKKNYPKGFFTDREALVNLENNLTKIPNYKKATGKSWIEDRGFLRSRVEQYGIKESNHLNFVSNFDYEYLAQINNTYRAWFEDKITIKYILKGFKDCLPEYYYFITARHGKNRIIRMLDCPVSYSDSFDDIFRLVRQKKILALKPDEGSHGEGFFKFTYNGNQYFLNGIAKSEGQIIELLSNMDNQYLITEFIGQHSEISRIYPGSVNTARVTVFKKDGKTAQIGNSYIRFGTSATGGVDNIGAGGIGADINIINGYFSNAVNSAKETCPVHPDTGQAIEGYLPHWEYVTKKVLEIANSLPEIEYMGFDVAFTENGIKLPEINRFPDYPRLNRLSYETMDYLLYKVNSKKKKYGYA